MPGKYNIDSLAAIASMMPIGRATKTLGAAKAIEQEMLAKSVGYPSPAAQQRAFGNLAGEVRKLTKTKTKPDFDVGDAFEYKPKINLQKGPDYGGRGGAMQASSVGMSSSQKAGLAADRAGEVQQLKYGKSMGQNTPQQNQRLEDYLLRESQRSGVPESAIGNYKGPSPAARSVGAAVGGAAVGGGAVYVAQKKKQAEEDYRKKPRMAARINLREGE